VSALQLLSGSRFELGIGIGRPGGESEAAQLGTTWGSATRRRARVREVVDAVRATVTPVPPVVITASGPAMLSEAAGYADRIGLALGPTAPEPELAQLAGLARTARAVPLTLQLSGIGQKFIRWGSGASPDDAADAAAVLPGDAGAAAELLQERLERFGIDELVVPEDLAEDILPVMGRLA
jgi:alkanesulfonate monooxygenase SsuD/methylene tetrahydromethanopterin reductase-like flavin-dependent oxidoreductase (luciferase family)